MDIELKDVEIGNRYLCLLPNCEAVRDYIVVEISPINLQKSQYIRLNYEDENSGIRMNKWMSLNTFLCSVLEKLEENNDVNDTYDFELPAIECEGLKPEIEKEKTDCLQDFVKLQSEYLKMLISEKKDTDGWKG